MIRETTVLVAVDTAGCRRGLRIRRLDADRQAQARRGRPAVRRPGARGRGVARLLLRAIQAAATEAGVTELTTHASWRAAPVFERLGFRQVEIETVQVGDQMLTRALMRKLL